MASAPPTGRGKPVPPVTVVIGLFCEAWKAHYGVSYIPTPRECGQLRLIAGRMPLDELPQILERYLGDPSPFVAQEMRHSLDFFLGKGLWNKYRVTAPVVSDREARGIEAGRQFINGKGDHARSRR